ncbi:ATP synthase F0 subunit B [Peribacillus simplex]|uniref:ATP synthase F0 subunit B n=1 Tax=Peribacillus simplex TaxID=1478 RepID=UPI0010BEF091|nr:ATP synthase F0 subunit B [Peribacillus simplex]TKH04807.1 ATP synthase F0 subunit B [Peribacillus simplex]
MVKPLTKKLFIDQVNRERERAIIKVETKNKNKLKKAQEVAISNVSEARKKANKVLNQLNDNIYLFGLDRYMQLDDKGKLIVEGKLPGRACVAIDAVRGKVYFISEVRFKPLSGAPVALGKLFGPYAVEREVEVTLCSMDLKGRNVTEHSKMMYKAPGGRPAAGALAFQSTQNQLLWLRPDGIIVSIDPQGGSFQELGKALPDGPTPSYDLVVSQSSGHLFWCFGKVSDEKGWEYEIWRSDTGLSNAKLIVSSIFPQAGIPKVKIGIDEIGQVFWNTHRAIEMSNWDGADRRTLYTFEKHSQGLEIEPALKRLYWIEDNHRLMSGSMDGAEPIEISLFLNNQHTFIENLSIITKADEAVGVLFQAQVKRQSALESAMEEKAKGQKEAVSLLAPYEEKLQDAHKKRDEQLAPILENVSRQRQEAENNYLLKKKESDEKIKAAEDQKEETLNEARINNETEIESVKNNSHKRIQEAQEELDKARAQ